MWHDGGIENVCFGTLIIFVGIISAMTFAIQNL